VRRNPSWFDYHRAWKGSPTNRLVCEANSRGSSTEKQGLLTGLIVQEHGTPCPCYASGAISSASVPAALHDTTTQPPPRRRGRLGIKVLSSLQPWVGGIADAKGELRVPRKSPVGTK